FCLSVIFSASALRVLRFQNCHLHSACYCRRTEINCCLEVYHCCQDNLNEENDGLFQKLLLAVSLSDLTSKYVQFLFISTFN
ncbi:hypothetical protein NPIL_20121, partial [Nephila pilipes]